MSRELSAPPSAPVEWVARVVVVGQVETRSRAEVKARTWFEARALAMAALGCGPDALTVRLKEEPR